MKRTDSPHDENGENRKRMKTQLLELCRTNTNRLFESTIDLLYKANPYIFKQRISELLNCRLVENEHPVFYNPLVVGTIIEYSTQEDLAKRIACVSTLWYKIANTKIHSIVLSIEVFRSNRNEQFMSWLKAGHTKDLKTLRVKAPDKTKYESLLEEHEKKKKMRALTSSGILINEYWPNLATLIFDCGSLHNSPKQIVKNIELTSLRTFSIDFYEIESINDSIFEVLLRNCRGITTLKIRNNEIGFESVTKNIFRIERMTEGLAMKIFTSNTCDKLEYVYLKDCYIRYEETIDICKRMCSKLINDCDEGSRMVNISLSVKYPYMYGITVYLEFLNFPLRKITFIFVNPFDENHSSKKCNVLIDSLGESMKSFEATNNETNKRP
jgi:hypothetical protein